MIDEFRGDYWALSNFSRFPVVYEEIVYPTAEHAFAAAKTLDLIARKRIAMALTPGDAKRIGRGVVLRNGWDQYHRYEAMHEILHIKFGYKHSTPGSVLLSTGSELLVEGNTWHDNTWGDCRCGRPACVPTGNNLLGWMLMRIREEY